MFRKLEINIPFTKTLAQMPHYAKFMKDIIRKKRKFDENGIVSLSVQSLRRSYHRKCKILEALLYLARLEIMNLGRHCVTLVLVSIRCLFQ